MESKGSHQLELSHLQNLVKRDPESYREEFLQQTHFFEASLQIMELNPDQPHPRLQETIFFLAHVSHCYPSDLSGFPQQLVDLLKKHATVLDPDLRLCLCRALILLRNRQLLRPAALITLFFELFKCRDKALRAFLKNHIVSDIKGTNARRRDAGLNSELQSFMYRVLNEQHKIVSKTALDIMIELYNREVWHDAKTVNVIVTACFSNVAKIAVTAINFFLGKSADNDDDNGDKKADDDDDDDDEDDVVDENARAKAIKMASLATRVRKKSRKRLRLLENLKKAHKKKKKKDKPEDFNFSALHLIHDPQTFAERLLRQAETTRDRFEVKLLLLDLTSRLIGTHELLVLNFYPHISRFLQPHQREVIRLLQFVAQASHALVPPDTLQPCVRVIADQFVSERNTSDTMAIGLNAVREIAKRCPLALDQAMVEDLTAYKTYKDRSVMMAARSLIQLYRQIDPHMLTRKDRGRPTEATTEIEKPTFGASEGKSFVPGAEALDSDVSMDDDDDNDNAGRRDDEDAVDEEDDEEEGEWEDVVHSSDAEDDDDAMDDDNEEDEDGAKQMKKKPTLAEKRAKAALVTSSRILSDADFRRIDAAQLKKQVQAASGGKKGELKNASSTSLVKSNRSELVKLSSIEMIHSKRKHDKESRLATVLQGREDRGKFGSKKGRANEHASTTHREKKREKNFMMVKHKIKKKAKRSFVQRQSDLKKALMRSKKFK